MSKYSFSDGVRAIGPFYYARVMHYSEHIHNLADIN